MGQFHDELPNLGEEWRHVALEAVVDDDGSVREVAVMIDTAVPWAAVSDGVDIGEIGGVDAVVIENADEPGIFLRRGDVARGVFNAVFSDDGDTLVRDRRGP